MCCHASRTSPTTRSSPRPSSPTGYASLRYTGIESHEGLTHYGLYIRWWRRSEAADQRSSSAGNGGSQKRRGGDSNPRWSLTPTQHFQCCTIGRSVTSPDRTEQYSKKHPVLKDA